MGIKLTSIHKGLFATRVKPFKSTGDRSFIGGIMKVINADSQFLILQDYEYEDNELVKSNIIDTSYQLGCDWNDGNWEIVNIEDVNFEDCDFSLNDMLSEIQELKDKLETEKMFSETLTRSLESQIDYLVINYNDTWCLKIIKKVSNYLLTKFN